MAYNAAVWFECRQQAVEFLKEISDMGILPKLELDDALRFYQLSVAALQEVSELFPFFGHKSEISWMPGGVKRQLICCIRCGIPKLKG